MKLKTILLMATTTLLLATGSCSKKPADDDTATATRIAAEVKAVNKLVLSQMSISKMATISDLDLKKADGPEQQVKALIDALKIGDRKAAFSYSTYMRAYIDLSSFSPEDVKINDTDSTISITLPAIQTEFAGRDSRMRVEHYRVSGLRSQIGAEERAAIKEKINAALKQEVENDDTFRRMLTESARSKGKQYFEELCGRYGYKTNVKFR